MWQWKKRIERMVTRRGSVVLALDAFFVFMVILSAAIWIQFFINL
ncbi:hypothetical protein [Bremerella sp. P1]|nr:hypothetical protein [Bremerella sp. P1]WDI41481.1 hypothetical protein PSR63_23730 [Bremerella sp. P1]